MPELHRLRSELRGPVALVPTMGALHRGHMALLAEARLQADHVIASIFVNPLQFDAAHDLNRYPRPEDQDLALLEQAGCDLAWLPRVADMYPGDRGTVVEPGPVAELWEGHARPGHFRGVVTVVTILFNQTRPDVAVFGEKDWQQLQVVRALVRDLAMPVRIVGVPTAREADGLALSSRNRFLTPEQRRIAPLLYATLRRTANMPSSGNQLDDVMRKDRIYLQEQGFGEDYYAAVDATTLQPIKIHLDTDYRIIAAVHLGSTRLLDNIHVCANVPPEVEV